MAITWKYVKELQDKNAINELCNSLNIALPNSLKLTLANFNGGQPSEKAFDTDRHTGYIFNSLYSHNDTDLNRINHQYAKELAEQNLFPIGIEATGDTICYDARNLAFVLLNHETNGIEVVDISSNPQLFNSLLEKQ